MRVKEKIIRNPVFLLCILFLIFHIVYLLQPISGAHAWRQSDTAAVARNFLFESPNLFFPRIDVRGSLTGITGMEFPLYQYVVSILFRLSGSDADFYGRLVSILSALLTFLFTAHLLRDACGVEEKFTCPVLFACPVFFIYSAKFMPEAFGLALAVFGARHYFLWRDDSERHHFFLALIALGFASLVRPFFIFWCLPILVDFLHGFLSSSRVRQPGLSMRRASTFFLGLGILIPFSLWYFFWSPYLVRKYGINCYYFGSPVIANLFLFVDIEFWWYLIRTLLQDYVNWPLIPLFLVGLRETFRGRAKGAESENVFLVAIWVPFLAVLVLIGLTGMHFRDHSYYFYAIIPSVVCLTAVGFKSIIKNHPKYYGILVSFLIVLPVASTAYHYKGRYFVDQKYEQVSTEVSSRTQEDDLFVVESDGGYAYQLYKIRRKGWIAKREELESPLRMKGLKEEGARWVLYLRDGVFKLASIEEWMEKARVHPVQE
jgi:hypothetical protein